MTQIYPPRVFLCIAVLMASCRQTHTPEDQSRIESILNARRPASLVPWQEVSIRGRDAKTFAAMNTALVLPPTAAVKMQHTHGSDGLLSVRITAKGKNLFFGSAVPLSQDGYFLTAAHNLDTVKSLILIAPASNSRLGKADARVVWKGDLQKGGPDLALLHAPLHPFSTVAIEGPHLLLVGTPIITYGYAGMSPSVSGGQILWLGPMEGSAGGARWRRLSHSAPLSGGDSGGPMLGSGGSLLAINEGITFRLYSWFGLDWISGYQALATIPDPAWIQSLIDRDRRVWRLATRERK